MTEQDEQWGSPVFYGLPRHLLLFSPHVPCSMKTSTVLLFLVTHKTWPSPGEETKAKRIQMLFLTKNNQHPSRPANHFSHNAMDCLHQHHNRVWPLSKSRLDGSPHQNSACWRRMRRFLFHENATSPERKTEMSANWNIVGQRGPLKLHWTSRRRNVYGSLIQNKKAFHGQKRNF